MTTFQHKSLPVIISYTEYSKLTPSEQANFNIINAAPVVNNISSTTVNNKTEDVLGLGTVATAVVVAPIAIVGGILGFFD